MWGAVTCDHIQGLCQSNVTCSPLLFRDGPLYDYEVIDTYANFKHTVNLYPFHLHK